MQNRRIQFSNRRQNTEILKTPFKDSYAATIKVCRRKVTDRRIDVIDLEYLLEDDTDLDYFDDFVVL